MAMSWERTSRGKRRDATGKFSRLALIENSSRAPKKLFIVCVNLLDTSGDPFVNPMKVNLSAGFWLVGLWDSAPRTFDTGSPVLRRLTYLPATSTMLRIASGVV
jgi:hypothetical protein